MKELTTDVLVIGGGGAGIAAALSAHQNNAKVILTEKMSKLGGSTGISGGAIGAANTRFQRALGIKDSEESWMKLWHDREKLSNTISKYPDYHFVDYFMKEAVKTTEWLVDYAHHKYAAILGFGMDPVRRLHFAGPANKLGGPILLANLTKAMKEKHIKYLTSCSAQELLIDDGEVSGAKFRINNDILLIHSKKTIIAAGGFAHNKEMLTKYIPEAAEVYEHCYSGDGNTGDGIKMAQKVGAALYEDPWIIGEGVATNVKHTFALTMDWSKLYVNGLGKRFMNEESHYSIVTNKLLQQKNPWLILDSASYNQDIITKLITGISSGEVIKADTISELARKMKIDKNQLTTTINEYNKGSKNGIDAFGKEKKYILPITTAPFLAVKIYPVIMGTFGGVKTNHYFQVLNNDGQVIKNLFATGESANRVIYNQVYMTGSSVQFALTSGRIAGKSAAKEIINKN